MVYSTKSLDDMNLLLVFVGTSMKTMFTELGTRVKIRVNANHHGIHAIEDILDIDDIFDIGSASGSCLLSDFDELSEV